MEAARHKVLGMPLKGSGDQSAGRSRQGSCWGAPCRVLTCLPWVIDGFLHLDEGACTSPVDQDLLLFLCTEVVAIGDVQVDSAHLLAACRLGDLGHKRGATSLAGSQKGQDGIRAAVLLSSFLLHYQANLFPVLL